MLDGGGGGEGGGGEEDGILNVCRGGRPSGKASLSGGIQMTVLQSLKKSLSRLTEILVFVLLIRQHRRLPIHESETSRLVYFQYWPTINWDSVWTLKDEVSFGVLWHAWRSKMQKFSLQSSVFSKKCSRLLSPITCSTMR